MIASPTLPRFLSFGLATLLAVGSPLAARGQAVAEAPSDAEASMADEGLQTIAVVALAGYDALLEDIDFLGELGGRPATADMLEGMLAFFTGGRGLEGLDKARPLGVVLQTDGASFTPLVCLPIADVTPVLELTEQFGFEPLEIGEGVYELELEEQTVFFQQVGEWTFVAQNAEALEQAPAEPTAMLAELVGDYDVGAEVMAQNVPEMYKQIAIEQLRQGMEEGMPDQQDDESDEDYQLRVDLAEAQVAQITDLIDGLDRVMIGWNIDSEAKQTYFDAEVTGVPESDLALAMDYYDDTTSDFTGFHRPGAALSLLTTGKTPPELIEKQKPQLEATVKMFRAQVRKAVEETDELPDDPEIRETLIEVANDFLDVYEDGLTSGKIEVGVSIDVAGEGFDAVGGAYSSDPAGVEAAFKKLAGIAPKLAAEKGWDDAPEVQWNADQHNGVAMHSLDLPIPPQVERLRDVVGESLRLTMGIGNEAVYLAVGPRGDEALKKAIDDSATRTSEEILPGEVIVSFGQILEAAEPFADGQASQIIGMLVDALSEAPENTDRLVVTTEAIDRGVKVRYLVEQGVLKAIGQAAATAAAMQQQQAGGF